MIVRKLADGKMLLVAQTDHSRLAGQFAAHWGNADFEPVHPYESVVRAATFHDFAYARYETAPLFDPATGETPNFRDIGTTTSRLEENQWCFDWLLAGDPYAATLAAMHRCGLWRGRYGVMVHPPHPLRQTTPEIDAFVARNEAAIRDVVARHGWDEAELRINYRLLQIWDNLSLYFSCQEPFEHYLEPVPRSYGEAEGAGTRLTLTPTGPHAVTIDPYPFDAAPLAFQLVTRCLPQSRFADEAAFRKAYFAAPIAVAEYVCDAPVRERAFSGALERSPAR